MDHSNLGRIPPQSIEAEKAVLGSCMLDKDALDEILDVLEENEFYREDHREIFEAIREVFMHEMNVDLLTVSDQLTKRGTLDKVGGLNYLATIASEVPTTASAIFYSNIVKEKATLRRLIKTSNDIMNACYEQYETVENLVQIAESTIMEINQVKKDNMCHASKALESTLKKLEDICMNKGILPGTPTGFNDLDYLLGGMQNGDLILVAGRPSMGKTAFAYNVAIYVSIVLKIPTAFFSMEMSKEKLMFRAMAGLAHVKNTKFKLGNLEDEDFVKLSHIYGSIYESKLEIDDTPHLKPSEIRSRCRRMKKKYGQLGLIVIDHLTEMWRPLSPNNDVAEHSENIRSCKRLAKEFNCPVILLQQLSRKVEARNDKRPMLSDLRETGVAEEVADVVIMLYRDDYYHPTSEKKNIAEVIVAKGRDTGTGTVELAWLPEYTKFGNLAITKVETTKGKEVDEENENRKSKRSRKRWDYIE